MVYSHNDYELDSPLYTAVKAGVYAVEVDIVYKNKLVKVGHSPYWPFFCYKWQLEHLYLRLLKSYLVHNSYHGDFYLILDFKSANKKMHDELYKLLKLNNFPGLKIVLTAGDNWFTKIFASRKKSVDIFYKRFKDNNDNIELFRKTEYEWEKWRNEEKT